MMGISHVMKLGLIFGALAAPSLVAGRALGGRGGMAAALVVAVGLFGAACWYSDRFALGMAKARRVTADEEPRLLALVAELAGRARIPLPAVYLIDAASPNAFAVGRDPSHAAVAVTTGLFRALDPREQEAVLAHELAHIRARDTLLTGVTTTVAGAMTSLVGLVQLSLPIDRRGEEGERGGIVAGVVMLLVAPIAATLLQLALSRTREFEADDIGARLCGDPSALASALRRLERGAWLHPLQVNPATSPLFIVHPLSGGGILRLFDAHPPTGERIARLEAMAGMLGNHAGTSRDQARIG